MKLPSEIVAFKLLRKANISKEENMFVLTGMKYKINLHIIKWHKRSLKKFKGNIAEGSAILGSSVKLEPVFLDKQVEALLDAGYVRQDQRKGNVKSRRGGERSNMVVDNGVRHRNLKRKMNPAGPDGKTLTCRVCGSY